jgi:hypothetical protein
MRRPGDFAKGIKRNIETYLESLVRHSEEVERELLEVKSTLKNERAEKHRLKVVLDEIVDVLSAKEWSPDTPSDISQILGAAGFEIRDIDED